MVTEVLAEFTGLLEGFLEPEQLRELETMEDLVQIRVVALGLLKANRYEEAVSILKRATLAYPRNQILLDSLSHSYYLWGSYEEAKEVAAERLRLFPDDPSSNFMYGRTLAMSGEREEAIRQLTLAIQLDSDPPHTYYGVRGVTYRETEQLHECISDMSTAISIGKKHGIDDEDVADWYVIRGKCYHDLGYLDKAREDLIEGMLGRPADVDNLVYFCEFCERQRQDRQLVEDAISRFLDAGGTCDPVAQFRLNAVLTLMEGRSHGAQSPPADRYSPRHAEADAPPYDSVLESLDEWARSIQLEEKVLPHLLDMLGTADSDMNTRIVTSISRMDATVIPELVKRLLETSDPPGDIGGVSAAIVGAIVLMGEKAISPLLDQLALHHSLLERAKLTPLLRQLASEVGMPALSLLLEAADRRTLLPDIGFALAGIGDEAVKKLLNTMAESNVLEQRDKARRALNAIGESAIDASIQTMVEFEGDDRFMLLILGYGPAALPYLRRAHDRLRDPAARSQVSLAIQGITGNALWRR